MHLSTFEIKYTEYIKSLLNQNKGSTILINGYLPNLADHED
jgi:hypothetical protein